MTVHRIPFAVASDESISPAFSRQRLLNVYPEFPQTQGKGPVLIQNRAGLKPLANIVNDGPVRGSCVMNEVLYVVSGQRLYSVDSLGAYTIIGTVNGGGSVIMSTNGTQLGIATDTAWVDDIVGFMMWGRNGTGDAFLYNRLTGTFGQIADPDLFLTGSGKFQISALNDASTYSALDFATAEESPDVLLRGFISGPQIYLCGPNSIEVWYVSGNALFPMERQNQNVIQKGIMGRECIIDLDNSIFFIGRDATPGGTPIAYRLNGYTPSRVSNHAAEAAFAAVSEWSKVKCISYIINGHAFFHVILESTSWVYDCATKLWHEEETTGFNRWQGTSHSYAYGKHIIGSYNDGRLFTLDPTYKFDGTTYITREMISVPLGDDGSWKTLARLQFDLEAGDGLVSGQGSDPQMMVQLSFDRGRNWTNEKWRSMGLAGNYGLRVRTGPHGRFRSVMVRVRITDPIDVRFMDYFADIV